jgi:hypothetical protein
VSGVFEIDTGAVVTLALGDGVKGAVRFVDPTVVHALEELRGPTALPDDGGAFVPAAIVEDVNRAVLVTRYDLRPTHLVVKKPPGSAT